METPEKLYKLIDVEFKWGQIQQLRGLEKTSSLSYFRVIREHFHHVGPDWNLKSDRHSSTKEQPGVFARLHKGDGQASNAREPLQALESKLDGHVPLHCKPKVILQDQPHCCHLLWGDNVAHLQGRHTLLVIFASQVPVRETCTDTDTCRPTLCTFDFAQSSRLLLVIRWMIANGHLRFHHFVRQSWCNYSVGCCHIVEGVHGSRSS